MPRRGLLSIDELRECLVTPSGSDNDAAVPSLPEMDTLSPQEQNEVLNEVLASASGDGRMPVQIVGLDPGQRELAVLSDPDREPRTRADLRRQQEQQHLLHGEGGASVTAVGPLRLRYTAAQRRRDMQPS
eukprot:2644338-Prymnesium_polylepis.1